MGADKWQLQVRGSSGEHSEAEGGKYDISNRERMGLTEAEAVGKMWSGVKAMIEVEKDHEGDESDNGHHDDHDDDHHHSGHHKHKKHGNHHGHHGHHDHDDGHHHHEDHHKHHEEEENNDSDGENEDWRSPLPLMLCFYVL